MAWRDSYLDLVLIPLGLLFPVAYHLWLWLAVRHRPLHTTVGINAATRRLWVFAMAKDKEENALVVVHSLRNVIAESTLVATSAVSLCTGMVTMLRSNYAAVEALRDAGSGGQGGGMMALKYTAFLLVFLLACLCHTLSVCFLNQAVFLVNAYSPSSSFPVSGDYVVEVLERGFLLNLAGNRVFFAGVPLLLWFFGPVVACVSSMGMVPVFYNIDMVMHSGEGRRKGEVNRQVEIVVENDVEEEQV